MKTVSSALWLVVCFTFTALADRPGSRLLKVVVAIDADGDGTSIVDSIATYSYDRGNLVGYTAEWDLTGDGVMDRRSTSTYTYDSEGKRILNISEAISLPDGTIQSRGKVEYMYDAQNRVVGALSMADFGGDGTVNEIQKI